LRNQPFLTDFKKFIFLEEVTISEMCSVFLGLSMVIIKKFRQKLPNMNDVSWEKMIVLDVFTQKDIEVGGHYEPKK